MKTFGIIDGKYVYYNRRPDGKHLQDCVCRAISGATGIDYNVVDKMLDSVAKEYECEKLCVCCYHNLLDGKFNFCRYYCKNEETVEEIAQAYPYEKLIIRIDGHLTCSVNGQVLDIWDCSNEKVDCYWIVR